MSSWPGAWETILDSQFSNHGGLLLIAVIASFSLHTTTTTTNTHNSHQILRSHLFLSTILHEFSNHVKSPIHYTISTVTITRDIFHRRFNPRVRSRSVQRSRKCLPCLRRQRRSRRISHLNSAPSPFILRHRQ